MEKKLFAGTIVGVVLLIGLWGTWKLLGGSNTATPTETPVVDLKITEADWKLGSSSPSATLVEYSDFQCPACKAYTPLVKAFVEKHKDSVQVIYRHFPLQQHQNATVAAYYAEAAGLQGKFFEMHDKLFDNQTDWSESKTPEKLFVTYAKELKLDVEKLKTDAASEQVKNAVNADLNSGNVVGVQATPTFFINGKKVLSPQSLDDFEKLLK